jgi:acyl-coenzyme A thioesterase PaaI-like protein
MSNATPTRNANLSDSLNLLLRGEIPPPPIAQLIGFTLTSIEPGMATVEFQASERHANPMGTLHGGVLCDVADAAMGMAYASTLLHDAGAEDQFPQTDLAREAASDRPSCEEGPNSWPGRV